MVVHVPHIRGCAQYVSSHTLHLCRQHLSIHRGAGFLVAKTWYDLTVYSGGQRLHGRFASEYCDADVSICQRLQGVLDDSGDAAGA